MRTTLAAMEQLTVAPAGNEVGIELRGVGKTFNGTGRRFTALDDIDLTIAAGEYLAIVGKSGSGKSTLLNLISGIDRPSRGEVWVQGTAIHALDQERSAIWRGRTIGIVFQFFQLLPTLTVLENVLLPMNFCGAIPGRERRSRALALLERTGVADQAHKLPAMLSGGQQQRAALARALANDPPILVADEPTGNLDSATAEALFGLFEELQAAGKTLVVVTHDRDVERRVRHTVRLADGRIVA